MHRTAVLSVCIALASFVSIASAQTPTRVTLEAKNLEIELPSGWIVDPDPGEWSLTGDVLRPGGVDVHWPTVEVMPGYGTCDEIVDQFRGTTPREPRIPLIPEAYHPTVAYKDKTGPGVHYVHTCLGAGRETIHVRLRFIPAEDNTAVTTLLATIARVYQSRPAETRPIATTPQASAGGERRLPSTGLLVTLPAGWSASAQMAGKQPADMLLGGGEHILVSRFPQAGCAHLIRNFEGQHKTTASPLPAFAPASFHGSVVVSRARGGISYTFCHSTGTRGIYAIIAGAALTEELTPELVGVLHSLARAIDQTTAPSREPVPETTSAPRTYLVGSALSVAVPTGWFAQRSQRGSITGDTIFGPRETMIIARSHQLSSCSKLLQHYAADTNGSLQALPSFAPSALYPQMLVSTSSKGNDVYTMCIRNPPYLYGLEAHVPPGTSPSAELTSLLHSIVDAIKPSWRGSGGSTVARTSDDSSWRPTSTVPATGNTLAFELHGTMLSPPSSTMMSTSYGVAGGLSRLNLGAPDDGLTLATEFVAVGGYSTSSGVTADLRAGAGASLSAGSKSRIGIVVGLGADGIGIGQEEGDPTKLVLPFGTLLYATAAVRTSIGDNMSLQLAGSYRARSNEAEYLGEARLHMAGRRAWSVLAFYKDIELASIIGGGIAFGL